MRAGPAVDSPGAAISVRRTESHRRRGVARAGGRGAVAADIALGARRSEPVAASDLAGLIQELTAQMHQAAGDLHFELAARIRDEIGDLKKELRQMSEATK